MAMFSAACHQVIFLASARKMTSCIFSARSQAPSEYHFILPPSRGKLYPNFALSGQITC